MGKVCEEGKVYNTRSSSCLKPCKKGTRRAYTNRCRTTKKRKVASQRNTENSPVLERRTKRTKVINDNSLAGSDDISQSIIPLRPYIIPQPQSTPVVITSRPSLTNLPPPTLTPRLATRDTQQAVVPYNPIQTSADDANKINSLLADFPEATLGKRTWGAVELLGSMLQLYYDNPDMYKKFSTKSYAYTFKCAVAAIESIRDNFEKENVFSKPELITCTTAGISDRNIQKFKSWAENMSDEQYIKPILIVTSNPDRSKRYVGSLLVKNKGRLRNLVGNYGTLYVVDKKVPDQPVDVFNKAKADLYKVSVGMEMININVGPEGSNMTISEFNMGQFYCVLILTWIAVAVEKDTRAPGQTSLFVAMNREGIEKLEFMKASLTYFVKFSACIGNK